MRKLLALLVVLAGAIPLFGQGTSFPVFNRQGWTMAGAVVSVCNGPADPGASAIPCIGAQTTTYVDWTLTTTCTNMTTVPNPPGPPLGPTHGTGCTNPGLTDSHGNATIFAANGFYWAQVAGYQVVPQSFPFDIGSGGGGGGLTPCGQPTDIQNYFTNIALGCDTGIGILDPSQHLISENHLNANQQVSVGNGTANGLMCQGHSNGTAIDAAYCTQPSATFATTGLGYGLFPPDNQPTGVGNVVTVSSLTTTPVVTSYGTIGFYPTHFVTAVSGLVSCEDWFPVWHCNANSPLTTSDVTPSANSFQANLMFASPLIPTDPASSLVQVTNPANCVIASLGTVTCSINAITPGNTLVAVSYVQCGLGCSGVSFPISDAPPGGTGNTWHNAFYSNGSGSSLPLSIDYAPITHGGNDIVTVAAAPSGANYNTQVQVFEIKGAAVPDVVGSEKSSVAPTSYAFNALTTTHASDMLMACVFQNAATSTYTQGSGWYLNPVMQGSLAPFASMGCEVQNQLTTGTYTPTMTGTGSGSGYSIVSSWQITAASNFGTLNPRWWRWQDGVAGGDLPDPTGQSGKCLAATGTVGIMQFIACSAGTSVSVNGTSVSSPNFNDTTPAAASSHVNVTWQHSGSSVSAQVAYATSSTFGVVEPDNSTVTISAGVISATLPSTLKWTATGSLIAPVSGQDPATATPPTNATVTAFHCWTDAATSAVLDLQANGASLLSAPVTCTVGTSGGASGGASGTISSPSVSANHPISVVAGTVTGTVGQVSWYIYGTRGP